MESESFTAVEKTNSVEFQFIFMENFASSCVVFFSPPVFVVYEFLDSTGTCLCVPCVTLKSRCARERAT